MRRARTWLPIVLVVLLCVAVVLAVARTDAEAKQVVVTAKRVVVEPKGPKPKILFPPPRDFQNLGSALLQLEARQVVALAKYRMVSRSYLRWRTKAFKPNTLVVRYPLRARCSAVNVVMPPNWCWYAHAAKWTERELANTRTRLKAEVGRDVWGPIDAYLRRAGSPLAGQGKLLYDIGKRSNVHPAFIVAVSEFESSLGIRGCDSNRKNIWGLAACDGRWHVPYFETWDEAVSFFVSFVNDRFPSARTPYDFGGYCVGGCGWAERVVSYMGKLGHGPGMRFG